MLDGGNSRKALSMKLSYRTRQSNIKSLRRVKWRRSNSLAIFTSNAQSHQHWYFHAESVDWECRCDSGTRFDTNSVLFIIVVNTLTCLPSLPDNRYQMIISWEIIYTYLALLSGRKKNNKQTSVCLPPQIDKTSCVPNFIRVSVLSLEHISVKICWGSLLSWNESSSFEIDALLTSTETFRVNTSAHMKRKCSAFFMVILVVYTSHERKKLVVPFEVKWIRLSL